MLLICIFIMEWPPKFVTYQDYKNELMVACNTHPDFEQWLMRKYCIREKTNTNGTCDELYVGYHAEKYIPSVQNLKEEYFYEMNMLIHEKIIKGVVLDIHLKNYIYTEDDIKSENLYNSKKIEYTKNKQLIKSGLLNENIPMFNMPIRMKYKKLLLKLIDDTIKDYSETIQEINSRN